MSKRKEETKEERRERKRIKKEKKLLVLDDEKTITEEVKLIVKDQHIDSYRQIDAVPDNLKLESLPLTESTLQSLRDRHVHHLFPIQAAAFGYIMEGKDLLARARTGTGKTLAFSLPMVEYLKRDLVENPGIFEVSGRGPQILIMAPTRELAIQVNKELTQICSGLLSTFCFYGGVMYDDQRQALLDGLDVVVGTPGRLIDHIEKGTLKLANVRFACLDEADQMLDIGFADDMEKVLTMVKQQRQGQTLQTLLFSATMPDWIHQAIKKYMKPDRVTLDLIGTSKQKTSATVSHYCLPSRWQNRTEILGDVVACYGNGNSGRTIIFVETKNEANELVMNEKLISMGANVLHGDISQAQREKTMQGYRYGKFSCLITTNVCARGVDIPEVDLVINAEPPADVESYIHRSGRTGRAGRAGSCVTFYKAQQEYLLQNITRKAGVKFNKISAPQPNDIIKARASQSIEEMKLVEEAVLPFFENASQELLAYFKGDASKALQCALAMICSTTKKLPSRSLLTANDGWITLLFKTEHAIRNVGYIRTMLQKTVPSLTYDDTIGWRMTADYMGVVVDVKEDKVVQTNDSSVMIAGAAWKDSKGIILQIPKELPELQASYGSGNSGRGNGVNSRGRGARGFTRGSRGVRTSNSRGGSTRGGRTG